MHENQVMWRVTHILIGRLHGSNEPRVHTGQSSNRYGSNATDTKLDDGEHSTVKKKKTSYIYIDTQADMHFFAGLH